MRLAIDLIWPVTAFVAAGEFVSVSDLLVFKGIHQISAWSVGGILAGSYLLAWPVILLGLGRLLERRACGWLVIGVGVPVAVLALVATTIVRLRYGN